MSHFEVFLRVALGLLVIWWGASSVLYIILAVLGKDASVEAIRDTEKSLYVSSFAALIDLALIGLIHL